MGEASDGDEAVEEFKRLHPDVVTMDIVMPRRSGIDAVKGIMEVDPSAKVVMCSALGQETLVQEALAAGALDFIVKPFKPDSVLDDARKDRREGVGAWISRSTARSSSKRRRSTLPR